jgi:hypothetical protein
LYYVSRISTSNEDDFNHRYRDLMQDVDIHIYTSLK